MYLPKLLRQAEEWAIKDRMNYKVVYSVIEQFIVDKGALMGEVGVGYWEAEEEKLEVLPRQFYVYDIYVEECWEAVKELAELLKKALADRPDINYVEYKEDIRAQAYTLMVDYRIAARVYELKKYKDIDILKVINPIIVKSRYLPEQKDLMVMSSEVQLMEVYRSLCNPKKAGDWEQFVEVEKELYTIFKQSRAEKQVDVDPKVLAELLVGGKGQEQRGRSKGSDLTREEKQKITTQLMKWCSERDMVVVGEQAFNLIFETTYDGKLQVIGTPILEEIEKIVTKTIGRPLALAAYVRELKVIGDMRLRRTTIKVKDTNREIMDFFNSHDYDLVPYNLIEKGETLYKVGNPFVLIRVFLFDFWIIRWIKEMSLIDERFAEEKIKRLVSLIITIRDIWNYRKVFIRSNAALSAFQVSRYIGVYYPEAIAVKIRNLQKKLERDARKGGDDYSSSDSEQSLSE
ncbi:hypothetical protein BNJ_00067 [Kaumoebavirus]|uniref:hypothetical protein n=1 Tax=Kaumoebavirus TaxID=1859492 RepID=UPI0009C2ECFA|nr:hypothetical protein BNJ_00067 [Kaumoebavirus]ARA71909.1 hypothetical protein BNJ_00067 [Kaumoebavirus]